MKTLEKKESIVLKKQFTGQEWKIAVANIDDNSSDNVDAEEVRTFVRTEVNAWLTNFSVVAVDKLLEGLKLIKQKKSNAEDIESVLDSVFTVVSAIPNPAGPVANAVYVCVKTGWKQYYKHAFSNSGHPPSVEFLVKEVSAQLQTIYNPNLAADQDTIIQFIEENPQLTTKEIQIKLKSEIDSRLNYIMERLRQANYSEYNK
jgi:hypothetical protein